MFSELKSKLNRNQIKYIYCLLLFRCDSICISGHVSESLTFFEISTDVNSHMPKLSQIKWNHGIMESWNYGIMESWNHGIMESWNHGIMESWNHIEGP